MRRFWQQQLRRNSLWRSYRVGQLLLRTLYIINRERTRVIKARQRGDNSVRPDMEALIRILREFRLTAVALGGLLIKLGQFLGARADLLPAEALAELTTLHDEVPPEHFEDVVALLEREWRTPVGEICATIERRPAGSASLGQVHQARLHDGRLVALKVQRPGIDAIVRTDLRTIRFVLRVVARVAPYANAIIDLKMLYREFSRTVFAELDYEQEARNARQFAHIFESDPDIKVPGIVDAYSTRRVLVLEWMDGIKISETAALNAAGVNRDRIATKLVGTYFQQVLEAGFFHADPHPGNLLVQPDPAGDRLVFLDFGMMGTVTPRMRDGLRECVTGVLGNNAARVLRGMDTLGFLSESADREALEPIVSMMLARFGGMNISAEASNWRKRGEVPREVTEGVGTVLYDQPFRLPAQFAFFGRMIGLLQGVAVGLSPTFNFIDVATPYAQQFLGGQENGRVNAILNLLGFESFDALWPSLLKGGVSTIQSLASLPQRIDHVLERAERGELRVVVESAEKANRRSPSRPDFRGRVRGASRSGPVWAAVGFASATALFLLPRFLTQRNLLRLPWSEK